VIIAHHSCAGALSLIGANLWSWRSAERILYGSSPSVVPFIGLDQIDNVEVQAHRQRQPLLGKVVQVFDDRLSRTI
jgi:hypothetical protein